MGNDIVNGSSINQMIAALAGISALVFWRGSVLGDVLGAIGQIQRVSRIVPLTQRVKRCQVLYWVRLVLLLLVVYWLAQCVVLLHLGMGWQKLIAGQVFADPGLRNLVGVETLRSSTRCVHLSYLASLVMLVEWLIDGYCRYEDLGASLAVVKADGCIERPETMHFRLERSNDVLALWQARIRYCIDVLGDHTMANKIEALGDAEVDWGTFSATVCEFRVHALRNEDHSKKRLGGKPGFALGLEDRETAS